MEKENKLIHQLTCDDKWKMQLDEVKKERIEGILLSKIIEYEESNRAHRYLDNMFYEMEFADKVYCKLAPDDFLFAHGLREIDEQKMFKWMNYSELKSLIRGKRELKENESPYYRFIKNIHIPFRFSMNVTMINDLRYDLALRMAEYANPKSKSNHQHYFNILQETINTTQNPILKSRLLLWKEFIEDKDLPKLVKNPVTPSEK